MTEIGLKIEMVTTYAEIDIAMIEMEYTFCLQIVNLEFSRIKKMLGKFLKKANA